MNGALFPFALAALAFAACALLHHRGRPVATLLYFFASLAIVYGLLAMLALPLRLAVLGTCPETGACPLGMERPITSSETTALGFSIGMGIVAILAGFFGLRTQYRHHRAARHAAATSTPPPARRIPPVGTRSEAQMTPDPSPVTAAKSSEVGPAVVETPAPAAPQAELPAHEPELELPAHTTEKPADAGGGAPAPAQPREPRRQRKPKTPPAPPAPANTE
jgi:hypothetical protein